MKFIITTLCIAVACFAVQFFLPWWSLAIVAFVIGAASDLKGWQAFLSGLIGVGVVWLGYSFFIDLQTNSILSAKVAQIFSLSDPAYLIAITGLIGALVGAFAALTGNSLRALF